MRTVARSARRARSWSEIAWKLIQDASLPALAPTRSRSSSSVLKAMAHLVCGTMRMRSTLSRCVASTSASRASEATRPPGLRKILASPALRPTRFQGVDAGVHARHDRHAGTGDAVEAGQVEGVRVGTVGREQVIETLAGRSDVAHSVSSLVCHWSPGRLEMVKAIGLLTSAKKSLPLSSTTMKAGKSSTSIFQTASMPSSSYSSTSTCLMQSCASRAAGPPIEPR